MKRHQAMLKGPDKLTVTDTVNLPKQGRKLNLGMLRQAMLPGRDTLTVTNTLNLPKQGSKWDYRSLIKFFRDLSTPLRDHLI